MEHKFFGTSWKHGDVLACSQEADSYFWLPWEGATTHGL